MVERLIVESEAIEAERSEGLNSIAERKARRRAGKPAGGRRRSGRADWPHRAKSRHGPRASLLLGRELTEFVLAISTKPCSDNRMHLSLADAKWILAASKTLFDFHPWSPAENRRGGSITQSCRARIALDGGAFQRALVQGHENP